MTDLELTKLDKEITNHINEVHEAKSISDSLDAKISSTPVTVEVNRSDILTELDTVKQMAKMTVGRQGNHFPIFTREYYHCIPRGRQSVLSKGGFRVKSRHTHSSWCCRRSPCQRKNKCFPTCRP